jgi:hypothetical protein
MSISAAFTEVLGTGTSFWLLLAALMGATLLASSGSVLRRYAAISLLFLGLIRIAPQITQQILDATLPTFQPWRLILWPLPMAALAAGGILGLLSLATTAKMRRLTGRLTLLALLLAAFFGSTSTLRQENQVRVSGPGLKVPPADFTLARKISQLTPGRAVVLAPDAIATWIPVVRNHDYPYLGRLFWANRLGPRIGWRESQKRWKLMQFVGGEKRYGMAPNALRQILRDREIDVVVFHRGVPWTRQIRQISRAAGGSQLWKNDRYEVWSGFPEP